MLFAATQAVYCLVNLALLWLLCRGAVRTGGVGSGARGTGESTVTTTDDRGRSVGGRGGRDGAGAGPEPATGPEALPDLSVLIPAYREEPSVLRETLASVREAAYPASRLTVFLVHERDDDRVRRAVADLRPEFAFVPVEVDPDDEETWRRVTAVWPAGGGEFPATKARALDYALVSLAGTSRDLVGTVVTVLDADTVVPPDLFRRGVAGLAEHDVVQAKQTVRNRSDGWLPRLEAMGMAGWCHAIYARAAGDGVPLQLLGKGYFVAGSTIAALGGWDPFSTTEDMELGVRAHRNGLSVGVLDAYVGDLCPAGLGAWLRQKRRWLAGPYDHVLDDSLPLADRLRFAGYTVAPQVLTLNNLVGVPAGLLHLLASLAGGPVTTPPAVTALVVFNLGSWVLYSVAQVRATLDALAFDSRLRALSYLVASNPLAQVLYASLWAVPVVLAVRDWYRDVRTFTVTPKRVGEPD